MLILFNYHSESKGFYSSGIAECDNIVDQNINLLDAFYSVTNKDGCSLFEIKVYVRDHDGAWTYTSVNHRVFEETNNTSPSLKERIAELYLKLLHADAMSSEWNHRRHTGVSQ